MTAIRVLVKKLEKFVQPLVSNERWVALAFFSVFLLQALILATVGLALWIVPSQILPRQLAEHQSPSPPPLDSAPLLDSAQPAGKAQPAAVPPPTDAMPIHASDTAAQKAFETDLDLNRLHLKHNQRKRNAAQPCPKKTSKINRPSTD
ncbi:MAG: hypothetical protein NTY15_16930 [Planctomycetota bacterium]|nr:hypothetical protein [Planctomycetota bacterium]